MGSSVNSSANCEIEAEVDECFTQRDDRTCYESKLDWNELRAFPQETAEALGSLREAGRQLVGPCPARSEASSNTNEAATVRIGSV